MKINKQTEIENYLKEPLKPGDDVYIYTYKYGVDNPGYNPFPDKSWNSSLRFVGFDLGGILSSIGFEIITSLSKLAMKVKGEKGKDFYIFNFKEQIICLQ